MKETNQDIKIELVEQAATTAASEILRKLEVQPSSRLMTTQEVADHWRVSVNKVLLAVETGELRAIRLSSRMFRYDPKDVEACEALWASTNFLDKP